MEPRSLAAAFMFTPVQKDSPSPDGSPRPIGGPGRSTPTFARRTLEGSKGAALAQLPGRIGGGKLERVSFLAPGRNGAEVAAELAERFIRPKGWPRGLDFAVRMLRAQKRLNSSIVEMNDPVMLLTLIVGRKRYPYGLDRADYLRCLEDHGADALRATLVKRCGKFFGNGALMNATFNDNEDCAIALAIEHARLGISPDIDDDAGKTPLMMAAVKGYDDLTHCLFQAGADPKRVDGCGRNVLHYACMRGNAHAFSTALAAMRPEEREAALSQCDARGLTPREQLFAEHDDDLLSDTRPSEDGSDVLTGRFEAEFSMWPGRLETDSCEMDRGKAAGSGRTLAEAVVANRRELESRFDELVRAIA
ncbi:MAG: ankyrin repeat domain-containing protein [Burkholderiaceae bacterium]